MKRFKYLVSGVLAAIAACGGCAHTQEPDSKTAGSQTLLECLAPPDFILEKASPKLVCREENGTACCAYDLPNTPCIIMLCSNNCMGWEPPLLKCMTEEEISGGDEVLFELGIQKPEEFEL